MSGFLGPDIIAQIREANDIVDVVQWLNVPLKKAGTNYRALCPFHKEKTPSFNVSRQRQSFHCFGCDAGGDVFKFVMLREGLDFPAAARRLAERASVPIPESQAGPSSGASRDQRERLYEIHCKTRDWFHLNLMRSRQAETARDYLRQRGFTSTTAKEFQLGYALPSWDSLQKWGRAQGMDSSLLQESGLVVAGERGCYDRFRDRLMIPISDEAGRVAGFSGRILSSESKEAKYVNSPETPIFKKGRILFGLDRSKRDLLERKTAVMCEGQLDWIRCFTAGIRNVIAPQGTALTEEQARLLKRYVDEVVLCFDSDPAGQKATWRNAETLIAAGLSVKAARIPEGEDPDSFIRTTGAEAFQACLEQAVDVFEYKAQFLARTLNMREPRAHLRAVEEMTPLLALVDNEPQRQRLIQNLSDILKMDTAAFLHEFERQRQRLHPRGIETKEGTPQMTSSENAGQSQVMGFGDYLLRLSLTDEAAARMLAQNSEDAWFDGYHLRRMILHVIRRTREGAWKAGWNGLDLDLNDADREQIGRLLTHSMPMTRQSMAVGLHEAVCGLRRACLQERCQEISRLLQEKTLSDHDRLQHQRELLDLARQIRQI
ncbi:MAG: DNA primase [Verrucomicrobia bacterium]|nr:DNA primase [Verrucomicrobiota bacterium]